MAATGDLELGDMGMIRESVQRLLVRVESHTENSANERQFSQTISMAPSKLRDLSPSSFDPKYVAIGPLHKKDEKVQYYEDEKKPSYMNKLMSRIHLPQEEILKSCMQKVYTSMERIKACYVPKPTSIIDGIEMKSSSGQILIYSDMEIAEMMVIDACFILEFLYSASLRQDPITRNDIDIANSLVRDMLLLENQIPFFVLEEIFQCTVLKIDREASLLKLIHPVIFFSLTRFYLPPNIKPHNFSMDNIAHILGLIHETYRPGDSFEEFSVPVPPTIHSAVDLDSAGVKFKPYQNPTWSLRMKVETYWFLSFFGYWCKPTLRIPILVVRHDTESYIHNLIAYEHLTQTCSYITSYVVAMGMLVKTQEDVAKLRDSDVIYNFVGSDEQVAHIINNLCKGVEAKDFLYKEEWETLSKYRQSNVAWLRRTYFNNPWNMIALFAGIILFFLTVVQTVFTIKSAK